MSEIHLSLEINDAPSRSLDAILRFSAMFYKFGIHPRRLVMGHSNLVIKYSILIFVANEEEKNLRLQKVQILWVCKNLSTALAQKLSAQNADPSTFEECRVKRLKFLKNNLS